ncbi:hypothetical protein R3W88_025664 [Solanum pinnatisectum]|uniref:S-protein homolog n=1 Tax=Solanum pinnatisectum TaxID=50273 RepID=A0AAV9M4B7_9SOLN|nr:hypothetical protein R3W88_025664 [Solanum pinnatisectum]
MSFLSMEISFSSLLVLSFLLFLQQTNAITVHVVDGIEKNNPQLIYHCASGSDDLGKHYPKFKDDFHFSFKRNIFFETVFFCHFWWGQKNIRFEVYRETGACGHETGGSNKGICYCFSSLLVLSILLFVQQTNAATTCHIVDGIEKNDPPIKFHCASGNDDLGIHYPKFNDDFKFKFGFNLFRETVFFCHFWWGTKDAMFEVYRDSGNCGAEGGLDSGTCYWLIKEDGFYFAPKYNPPASELIRKYGW